MSRESYRAVFAGLCLGVFLSVAGFRAYAARACDANELVHRGLTCEAREHGDVSGRAELTDALRAQVDARVANGQLIRAAVYYRDLLTGTEVGVNEYSTFAPASMLKLPIAFALLRLRAHEPGLFERELLYAPSEVRSIDMLTQNEVAPTGLQVGSRYTVGQLLHAVLAYSDNLAYYLLIEHASRSAHREVLARTLQELGVVDPPTTSSEVATPREYGALFRQLFAASYLDTAASNDLLAWLSESPFDKGLAAGVPEHVALANKFGERKLEDGTRQLHDCGIVYHPDRPYVLCVMTKGRNFAALQDAIAELSRSVYAAVDGHALER